MMLFLTAAVTSRYPTTNNQLRTSSNPRQQATIYDGKVTVQPVQGRQTTYAAGTTRKYTPVITTHNAAYQADDLDALTLIVMNSFSQDIALMGPILKEWLQMHSLRNSKKLDDSDSVCVHSNDCMSSDNECVSNA
ncbi:hypothetical protein Tco_0267694 [Tanacetum coccineum]